jgi:uncharacterized membrane protein
MCTVYTLYLSVVVVLEHVQFAIRVEALDLLRLGHTRPFRRPADTLFGASERPRTDPGHSTAGTRYLRTDATVTIRRTGRASDVETVDARRATGESFVGHPPRDRANDDSRLRAHGRSAMNSAVVFGLGTMIAWGFWIVFGDVASNSIDPVTAAAISYVTAAVVTVAYALVSDASLAVTGRGFAFSVVAGVAAAVGVVSTFVGVSVGSTAVVSSIGGMYFVTAAVIGVVALGDPVSFTKVVGIGLAVVALVLITL